MDIYSKPGTRVKYLGSTEDQVTYGGYDDPRYILVVGELYTIRKTEVYSSHTEVYLEEVQGVFNSVVFEDIKKI